MSDRENTTNRQILFLFIGFLALFVIVFSLGVIVGKELSAPEGKTGIVERENPISIFDDETDISGERRTESEERSQETFVEEPEETVGSEESEEEQSFQQTQVQEDSGRSEKLQSEEGIAPSPVGKAKSSSEPAVMKEARTETKQESSIPQPGSEEKAEEKREKIIEDIETKKEERLEVSSLPSTEPGGKYTIQVASFREQRGAEQLMNSLSSKGYPAFVKAAEISGQGTWYRVRVGTFHSKEQARLYAKGLKNKEPRVEVLVTVNN